MRPEHHLLAEQLARQIFPHARTLLVSKTQTGASTWVYRIAHDQTLFYLRVLPEENASFAPEVYVHCALAARGLHVPEIVYFEDYNQAFQRSVMVTTAIAGVAIALDAAPEAIAPVLREAGRELALINQLPVDGFGWVQRATARTDEVRGENPTFDTWMELEIEEALALFARLELLSPAELMRLQGRLARAIEYLRHDTPTLAHGDFDSTHIFHTPDKYPSKTPAQYTGIIDFGEIRGANWLYDLAHFSIESTHFLPALLAGYQEISPLPVDYDVLIQQAALLIAVKRTSRRGSPR